ncbi:MAG TPA: hypothetical protein VEJ36_03445 [Nitrososphaerales archaeon]|nr:hypothetical protein [Nitrososphaerales archaeon]
MMVRALFCDYDGTLAPLRVSRANSKVPERLARTLSRVHSLIPVAVVTAKDYGFVRSRTPFADAWSCVYGIETVLKNGKTTLLRPLPDFSGVLRTVRGLPGGASVEYKRASTGELCGLCVEWKRSRSPSKAEIESNICRIRALGFQVLHDPFYLRFDVIPANGGKGAAVQHLQFALGVDGGVVFLGDSEADNPAFRLSEVSIGVLSGSRMPKLDCRYYVMRDKLGDFLGSLVDNGLEFNDRLPHLSLVEASS